MSISNDLSKILKQAGVDPSLYDTERPGFRKDYQRPKLPVASKGNLEVPKKEKKHGTLDVSPLQEHRDPQSRIQAIAKSDEDTGLKLIYKWARTGSIQFDEFEDLLAEIVAKIRKKL